MQTILMVVYAVASVLLLLFFVWAFGGRINWSDPAMSRWVFEPSSRTDAGTGATGAAVAGISLVLHNANPGVVFLFCMLVGAMIGAQFGAGWVPAMFGGLVEADRSTLLALIVVTTTWFFIGGYLAMPVMALALWSLPLTLFLAACVGLGMLGLNSITSDSDYPKIFGARVDRNLCASWVSLQTFGSPVKVERQCLMKSPGSYLIEGAFTGRMACGKAVSIVRLDVSRSATSRINALDASLQFNEKLDHKFPQYLIKGSAFATERDGEFHMKVGDRGFSPIPSYLNERQEIFYRPALSHAVQVEIKGSNCATFELKRCAEPAGKHLALRCIKELESMGARKLYW